MKILYAAASPVPSKAANSVHVAKMAQALALNGHDVTLMSPKPPHADGTKYIDSDVFDFYGLLRIFKFAPYPVTMDRQGTLSYAFAAMKKQKRENFDFIFTRCLPTALVATLCFSPVLYERHSDFWGSKLQEFVYRLISRLPTYKGTIVVSHALKDLYVNTFKTPKHLVHVAADGSDPIQFDPQATPPFEKNGRKAVGYIGHLYKGRGIDLIAEMARHRPQYDFHIVGGNDNDLAFWKKQLKDVPNMVFHGHVQHAHTKNFLLNFDTVLAPYQKKVIVALGNNTEKWMSPLKIFESMSSGKPLICSDMPVLREVLEDDVNCVLCPPEDNDAWVRALDKVLTDESYAKRISDRALFDFMEHYTWQRRANKIVDSVFGKQ